MEANSIYLASPDWGALGPGTQRVLEELMQPDHTEVTCYWRANSNKTVIMDLPTRALMRAVLENGIDSFREYFLSSKKHKQALYREAENWIFGERGNDWIFSFRNTCECLGLSPTFIRGGLRKWREAELKKRRR